MELTWSDNLYARGGNDACHSKDSQFNISILTIRHITIEKPLTMNKKTKRNQLNATLSPYSITTINSHFILRGFFHSFHWESEFSDFSFIRENVIKLWFVKCYFRSLGNTRREKPENQCKRTNENGNGEIWSKWNKHFDVGNGFHCSIKRMATVFDVNRIR